MYSNFLCVDLHVTVIDTKFWSEISVPTTSIPKTKKRMKSKRNKIYERYCKCNDEVLVL